MLIQICSYVIYLIPSSQGPLKSISPSFHVRVHMNSNAFPSAEPFDNVKGKQECEHRLDFFNIVWERRLYIEVQLQGRDYIFQIKWTIISQ